MLQPRNANNQYAYANGQYQAVEDNPYLAEANAWLNRAVQRLAVKRSLHCMNPKLFHKRAWYSWLPPHSYQLPGQYYGRIVVEDETYKHRDVFRRRYTGLDDDRYLSPLDGRVERLVVQSTNRIYDTNNDSTWRRTYIENISPYLVRVAFWPTSNMPRIEKSADDHEDLDKMTGFLGWNQQQWTHVGIRWLPACIGVLLIVRESSHV